MPGLRDTLRTLTTTLLGPGSGPRVAGPPRSPNGASSFHLIWEMPDRMPQRSAAGGRAALRLVEVSAVLEVLVPPQVPFLYFWALQMDFEEGGLTWGGGHTGLQWNPRFSGNTAVNWGGYATQERGGAVLPGTTSSLPAFTGDPHTVAYRWRPERPYRLRVHPSPEVLGGWRAEITDVTSGRATAIRDLLRPGTGGKSAGGASGSSVSSAGSGQAATSHLRAPLVWSEVFAACDAPSVVVRWSEFEAITEDGSVLRPEAMRVNYQTHQAGGCANTTVRRDGTGLLQITGASREIGQGTRLAL
jgi:hypothetical protein